MNKDLILQKLNDLIELLELCKGDIEINMFDAGGSYLDDAMTTCKKLSTACWDLHDETQKKS